jgi:hypothetical protein
LRATRQQAPSNGEVHRAFSRTAREPIGSNHEVIEVLLERNPRDAGSLCPKSGTSGEHTIYFTYLGSDPFQAIGIASHPRTLLGALPRRNAQAEKQDCCESKNGSAFPHFCTILSFNASRRVLVSYYLFRADCSCGDSYPLRSPDIFYGEPSFHRSAGQGLGPALTQPVGF